LNSVSFPSFFYPKSAAGGRPWRQNQKSIQALFNISKVNAASGSKDFPRLPMVKVSA